LQGYKLNFVCNKVDQKYASFVLLIDAVLDKDVASVDIDLYLVDKMVNAYVSPCGPIHLEAEQVCVTVAKNRFYFLCCFIMSFC